MTFDCRKDSTVSSAGWLVQVNRPYANAGPYPKKVHKDGEVFVE